METDINTDNLIKNIIKNINQLFSNDPSQTQFKQLNDHGIDKLSVNTQPVQKQAVPSNINDKQKCNNTSDICKDINDITKDIVNMCITGDNMSSKKCCEQNQNNLSLKLTTEDLLKDRNFLDTYFNMFSSRFKYKSDSYNINFNEIFKQYTLTKSQLNLLLNLIKEDEILFKTYLLTQVLYDEHINLLKNHYSDKHFWQTLLSNKFITINQIITFNSLITFHKHYFYKFEQITPDLVKNNNTLFLNIIDWEYYLLNIKQREDLTDLLVNYILLTNNDKLLTLYCNKTNIVSLKHIVMLSRKLIDNVSNWNLLKNKAFNKLNDEELQFIKKSNLCN